MCLDWKGKTPTMRSRYIVVELCVDLKLLERTCGFDLVGPVKKGPKTMRAPVAADAIVETRKIIPGTVAIHHSERCWFLCVFYQRCPECQVLFVLAVLNNPPGNGLEWQTIHISQLRYTNTLLGAAVRNLT